MWKRVGLIVGDAAGAGALVAPRAYELDRHTAAKITNTPTNTHHAAL